MARYHLFGGAGAGSLVVEFLLRESNVDYDIVFTDKRIRESEEFLQKSPLGRIPVLVCPGGKVIYESLAIVAHLTDSFTGLAPQVGDPLRDKYNQYIALIATTMYPAYHRQYHTYQYGPEASFDGIRRTARDLNTRLFDYIESLLDPYLCGEILTAADFYLYMLCRWERDKGAMQSGRPRLTALLKELRIRDSVSYVLSTQPKAAFLELTP